MSRTAVVAVLAVIGALVASYLALVQLGVVAHPWDPVFGEGSTRRVLDSALSRALPVPDAALGALAYLVEAVLAVCARAQAFRRSRPLAAAYGLVALGLLGAAVVLVVDQALVVRAFCSLCLLSAAVSVVAAALVIPEALERWRGAGEEHGSRGSRPSPSTPRTTRRSTP